MTDLLLETASATTQPARFRKRVAAMIVDQFVVSLVLSIAALLLFQPTHGAIRIGNVEPYPFFNYHRTCTESAAVTGPSAPAVVSGYRISRSATCVSSVWGIVFNRVLELTGETGTSTDSRTWTTTLPLDEAGQVTRALYLDDIVVWAFGLGLYLLVLEARFGTTLGKRLVGIRIQSVGNGRPTLAAIFRRLLVLMLPVAPLVPLFVIALALNPADPFLQSSGYRYVSFALGIVSMIGVVAVLANLLRASMAGTQPWHDRWAGTKAVAQQ